MQEEFWPLSQKQKYSFMTGGVTKITMNFRRL